MEKTQGRILVIDDDQDVLVTARIVLKKVFTEVTVERDPANIYKLLGRDSYDVILLDMNFKAGATSGREGLHWLKEILRKDPNAQVVLNTAYGDVELAVHGMKEGAVDFVVKPWDEDKLLATIRSALRLAHSNREVQLLKQKQQVLSSDLDRQYQEMLSVSPAMEPIFETIDKVAATDATVLILGENGTGKELVARALHRKSPRAREAFIKVDLGAITESLFESELFGHTKGSFTDAREDRPGRFEVANGGTLFLDEIGNLSLPLQAKLLSALQNRQIVRVGSNRHIPIDIRLICATNMPLYDMVANGSFRQDLLYRINTVEVTLPPLRERPEDVPLLAQHFLCTYADKYNKGCRDLDPEAMYKLTHYRWPGNIRELQHAMERAVIMSEGNTVKADDIMVKSDAPSGPSQQSPTAAAAPTLNLEDMEREAIRAALSRHNGNVSKAAKELGMGRNTLYRKLEKYDL
jgi:two-component system, NtrC family, response regulator HydG